MAVKRKRLLFVFGTRPEAIKLAPVIVRAQQLGSGFQALLAVTGQHREMLQQVLNVWDLQPDFDLRLMRPGQTLNVITQRALAGLDPILTASRPDAVVVQGDTSSAFVAALAAFYRGIPVAHVEAGLRTYDLTQPFPEEANRRMISILSTWHFAATFLARANLLAENIPADRIFVTGNPVIDALQTVLRRFPPTLTQNPSEIITAHRRENWGSALREICLAVKDLAQAFPAIPFVFPVHRNPVVQRTVSRILKFNLPNVRLLSPLPYPIFIQHLANARLVLTDSGGIQEEAPALGIPAIILRHTTERQEALAAGCRLVPPQRAAIVKAAKPYLQSTPVSRGLTPTSPYGDGQAAKRILDGLGWIFGLSKFRPRDFSKTFSKPFVPRHKG